MAVHLRRGGTLGPQSPRKSLAYVDCCANQQSHLHAYQVMYATASGFWREVGIRRVRSGSVYDFLLVLHISVWQEQHAPVAVVLRWSASQLPGSETVIKAP